ncbi:MAG: hypothetical protein K6357_02245 [Elusimicrobiota bacterium]
MYELIISDFSNIENIISFLSDERKLEIFKTDFGIIEKSQNFTQVYNIYLRAKTRKIKLKIIREIEIKLPILKKINEIEIKDWGFIFDRQSEVKIKEIEKILLHFIRKPSINISDYINIEDFSDLITLKTEMFIEIVKKDERILISPDCLFKNTSRIFNLSFSSEKNILNIFDYIFFLNPTVETGPVSKIYKKTNNYVKYFVKEIIDEKELLWMTKTKQTGI